MKKFKKIVPLLLILSLSIAAWFFDLPHYFSFETFKTHQKIIEQFVTQNFLLSILIYATTYITIVALAMPGATFMSLTGGFLFDQWIGTGVVVLSSTTGASLLFLSAKTASSDLLAKRIGGLAKKMQEGFQENAFSYLLTLRLIPLFPFIVVNLASALFQIPFKFFLLGTLLGIIPGSFMYVSMGVGLREAIQKPEFSPQLIFDPKILIGFIGLGLLSLSTVFYKHLKKHRSKSF